METLPATMAQTAYQWRNDDGSETTATAAGGENVDMTAPISTRRRLRIQVSADGDPNAMAFKLEYRKVGDSTWKTAS
jgi:hypothetical protein